MRPVTDSHKGIHMQTSLPGKSAFNGVFTKLSVLQENQEKSKSETQAQMQSRGNAGSGTHVKFTDLSRWDTNSTLNQDYILQCSIVFLHVVLFSPMITYTAAHCESIGSKRERKISFRYFPINGDISKP